MSRPSAYKLGGINVVDINNRPHYVGTQIPLKRDPKTGAPLPTYTLGGQNVYDLNGVPHYLGNDKPLQVNEQGRPTNYVAPVPTPTPTETGPKLDPNATESFKTAFNAGNNNMDQIQAMYADGPKYKDTGKTALQIWAEKNPALAQKEYLKKAFNTDGTPKILDKTEEGFDKPNAPGVVESVDGMQLPNSISINATNELLDNMSEADDSQAFLKNYIMAMQNN